MNQSLQRLGFTPFFAQQLSVDELSGANIARVTQVQRSVICVSDGSNDYSIPAQSALPNEDPEHKPTVGDWLVLDEARTRVVRVLDRKSVFRRAAAGDKKIDVQLIAANIDILFIVTSCNEEFTESRLERYLALAAEADVLPVVVLTKADLTSDTHSYVERARRTNPDLAVELVNALDGNSCESVSAWIEPGTTVAVAGSSGVGKSTLVNTLATSELASTGGIREDDKKGRHTTSYRALYSLPGGGLIIDVPGMRELKVVDVADGLASVFDDIETLAKDCKFADCQHGLEPDCAVRNALAAGEIDERRFNNYLKLVRENERNSISLAEKRSKDRSFAKLVKEVKALKQGREGGN